MHQRMWKIDIKWWDGPGTIRSNLYWHELCEFLGKMDETLVAKFTISPDNGEV